MLLQFLPTAVVGRRYPELQSLPLEREACVLGVDVLYTRHVQRNRRRLSLNLVVRRRLIHIGRGFPRHRDDLDRVSLCRLGGRDDKLLTDDGDLLRFVGHDITQHPRQRNIASNLKQVSTVASQFRGWTVCVSSVRPRRFGEEEHAMKLRRQRYRCLAIIVVEKYIIQTRHGKAKQLVIAGYCSLALGRLLVHGLFECADNIRKRVVKGIRKALQRRRGLGL